MGGEFLRHPHPNPAGHSSADDGSPAIRTPPNPGLPHPPTAHFIATVDDLTDMLDFDSEDIDGIYNNAGEEQEPPPTGR